MMRLGLVLERSVSGVASAPEDERLADAPELLQPTPAWSRCC